MLAVWVVSENEKLPREESLTVVSHVALGDLLM